MPAHIRRELLTAAQRAELLALPTAIGLAVDALSPSDVVKLY
jgi:hypothetical protein